MYFYDKKEKNFLNDEVNSISQDCIQITDEEFQTLVDKRSSGAIIYVKDNVVKASELQPDFYYTFDETSEKWIATDEQLKQAILDKKESLNSLIENKVLALINQSKEYTAFDQQRLEAQIWTLDNSNPVPLLTSISETIGIPLPELVKKCLEKTEKQSRRKGVLIGQEVEFKRKVKKATTLDELEKIEQDIQNWK